MKKILKFVAAAAMATLAWMPAQAQDKSVKIGTMGWEDEKTITLVTKKFLEKQGYKVDVTEFSEWGIAFAALEKKDVDLMVALPDYVTSDYWQKNRKKLEKVSVVSYGNYQTLAVPSYMKIDSIDQLNTVSDQVGGKIIGIEPGSGIMRDAARAVDEYKLNYQIVEGSTAAMVAQLQSAIERKEPIVTMLWDPSWMMHKFDVKFLKDPKKVFPPTQSYYWIANKGFSAQNPELRANISTVFLPIGDIGQMCIEMADGKTAEQAADDWWAANTSVVEKWSIQ
ncbi:glycine betaine ABC transporter substrate-binding protein [Rhizobium sp. NXC24]|uniref:glycine betaine ABC transporter substrate-binding protein n=1 Tax=Rhizobium sp. NXC24 TaxID=2048897 RepID=UPI000CDF4F04|nr:glycine betaine ABC transporter substrate-binding protein [Rhizobium sp. NXC24]AVA21327.1 proline/glycine betaine ABC transporter substrate-binding protein [Rhizobium sp. NXC24]